MMKTFEIISYKNFIVQLLHFNKECAMKFNVYCPECPAGVQLDTRVDNKKVLAVWS